MSDKPDSELADRLARRTLELVNIASQSRSEEAITRHLLRLFDRGGVKVSDLGDSCIFVAPNNRSDTRVLLGGHVDTVPAQDNFPGRCEHNRVIGLGASDMKGGVAVMVELALAGSNLGMLFFGREELPPINSALVPLLARHSWLSEFDLAVMLEPTDNDVHAGCVGNMNATWTFSGRSGHSARPWQADNAIEHAAIAIGTIANHQPQQHSCGGLAFTETVAVTRIAGGIADNVIPAKAHAHINYRYPPNFSPAKAEERLRELCASHGELEIVSHASSAPVVSEHPVVKRIAQLATAEVLPKQAWTPVAEFAQAGLAAINFGPGDPSQAHQVEESIAISSLVTNYRVFEALL